MLKINAQTGEAEEISVFDLLEGGVRELADLNLRRVLDNIADMNTEAKKVRTLTVTFTFLPNEARDAASCSVAVTCKTVPVRAVATTLDIGREGGEVVAVERPKYMPGQLRMETGLPDPLPDNVTDIRAHRA